MRIVSFGIGMLILALMLFPLAASAQVYKWIDQHGKVQYGDRPPMDKKDSEILKSSSDRAGSYSSSQWEERDREFRKRRIERQAQAEKETPTASGEQLCLNARYKLQMLDGKSVYRINEKGERIYIEDAERNAIEAKAKKDIAMYCPR